MFPAYLTLETRDLDVPIAENANQAQDSFQKHNEIGNQHVIFSRKPYLGA